MRLISFILLASLLFPSAPAPGDVAVLPPNPDSPACGPGMTPLLQASSACFNVGWVALDTAKASDPFQDTDGGPFVRCDLKVEVSCGIGISDALRDVAEACHEIPQSIPHFRQCNANPACKPPPDQVYFPSITIAYDASSGGPTSACENYFRDKMRAGYEAAMAAYCARPDDGAQQACTCCVASAPAPAPAAGVVKP